MLKTAKARWPRWMMLLACTHANASEPDAFAQELTLGKEEVYVFRTVRSERNAGATPFCEAANFASTREDHYTLWSLNLDAATGRVTDAHVGEVGGFRACFGTVSITEPFAMYAAGDVGAVSWSGTGTCALAPAQPPIRTALAFNCSLAIDASDDYAGGWLVSSTLAPLLGAEYPPDAHIEGYLSTSVVTLRLWKAAEAE